MDFALVFAVVSALAASPIETRVSPPHRPVRLAGAALKNSPDFGYCKAPKNPLRRVTGADTETPSLIEPAGADLTLFLVAPNHNDWDGGNIHRWGVVNLARRIYNLSRSPRTIIVAISETSGCGNCGASSADVVAGELSSLYGEQFQTIVHAPLPTDYVARPALIVGPGWKIDTSAAFAQDFNQFVRHNSTASPYGRAYVDSVDHPGQRLVFLVAHFEPRHEDETNAKVRREQATTFMQVARAEQLGKKVSGIFIAADLNISLLEQQKYVDDGAWTAQLLGSADWATAAVGCWTEEIKPEAMWFPYRDILNIALYEGDAAHPKWAPFAYVYDANAEGGMKNEWQTLRVDGSAHPMFGVLFKLADLPPKKEGDPAKCKALRLQIPALEAQLAQLQQKLATAAPTDKPKIVEKIAAVNDALDAARAEAEVFGCRTT